MYALAMPPQTPFWADNHSDVYVRVLSDELQFSVDGAMNEDAKGLIHEVSHHLVFDGKLLDIHVVWLAPTTRPSTQDQRASSKAPSLLLHGVRTQILRWTRLKSCPNLLQRLVTCVLQALYTFVGLPNL